MGYCPVKHNHHCDAEQCQWWVREESNCAIVVIAKSSHRGDAAEKNLLAARVDYITELHRDRRLQEAAEAGTPL